MSGKSPAYAHRRKNSARAGKPVAGFLNRTAIRTHGRFHPPCQRIAARGVPQGRRPNQLAGMRVTWRMGNPQNDEPSPRDEHDGLPDIACAGGPGRDRGMGGGVVSAEIIPFVPRRNREREPVYLPAAVFRSTPGPDLHDHVTQRRANMFHPLIRPGMI